MFNKSKRKAILNSEKVMFTHDVEVHDMFGGTDVIPNGTIGIISGINITDTVYDVKYYENVEVTYGKNQRVLLRKYWEHLIPVSVEGEI